MSKHRAFFVLSLVILVASTLACNFSRLSPSTPAPTTAPIKAAPKTALPTPTVMPSQPQAFESANSLQSLVEAVYENAGPSVVNIKSRVISYDAFMQPIPQEGTGSGFVYDTEGHIVTNYHVVADAESVSVALASGAVYEATIVGTDPANDLAVIRIEAEELPSAIPLGDSDQLRVGQFVVAIGNPFALDRTLTLGVISSLGRVIQSPEGGFIGEAIQTDASINPGNSGGPLLDLEGRVIGVNSQIISPSRASAGIGFAVSVNTVRRVVPELIANGHYPHPWLGVGLLPFTPEGAKILRQAGADISVDQGLLITEVVKGSPAEAAGVRAGSREVTVGNTRVPVGGDIIVAVNGEPTTTFEALNVYLESQTRVGDTVTLTLIRDGQEAAVEVTLAERPK
jgi:S1-C subfamily serine protease